jgi:hypothetical protein
MAGSPAEGTPALGQFSDAYHYASVVVAFEPWAAWW